MARYGSERIRGHGIPEAIEAILINGSRVQPRVAILKPLSSAISIGSGGPFGAEGPIIMTGGAFGSMIAQFFHLTSAERKTLLVAGRGGAACRPPSPRRWPRCCWPWSCCCSSGSRAASSRWRWPARPRRMRGATCSASARSFPCRRIPRSSGRQGLLGCVLVGLLAGRALGAADDRWSTRPKTRSSSCRSTGCGGRPSAGWSIGVGGLIFPQALGVGYDTIGALLQGDVPQQIILGVLLVKSIIWAVSLGSGTSGGVLAPLLMMGGALGGLEALFLPHEGAGFWPLISMGAILGGTMRSPFTGIVFALELTHDVNSLLPLRRGRVHRPRLHGADLAPLDPHREGGRRGYHLSREYAVDPLEILFVREVMRTNVVALPARPRPPLWPALSAASGAGAASISIPVVDEDGALTGRGHAQDLGNVAAAPRSRHPDRALTATIHAERR